MTSLALDSAAIATTVERLGYFELWTGFEPWKIQGQIFPGDPPSP